MIEANEETIREIRAAISEILDPLYAARLHNIPYHRAAEMAIARLQAFDRRLLEALQARTGHHSPGGGEKE